MGKENKWENLYKTGEKLGEKLKEVKFPILGNGG